MPDADYTLCGSLCTVADVLVREVKLKKLEIGDILEFAHCGAYSVTEAPALFCQDSFRLYMHIRRDVGMSA